MQQQHLTLQLTRIQGSFDMMEDRKIRVDLPLDATEADARLAFHHVDTLVAIEGQAFLDAAVELVASIIESREAIADEGTGAPMTHGDLRRIEEDVAAEDAARDAHDATPIETALDTARSMDEQRTERAVEQATTSGVEQDLTAAEIAARGGPPSAATTR